MSVKRVVNKIKKVATDAFLTILGLIRPFILAALIVSAVALVCLGSCLALRIISYMFVEGTISFLTKAFCCIVFFSVLPMVAKPKMPRRIVGAFVVIVFLLTLFYSPAMHLEIKFFKFLDRYTTGWDVAINHGLSVASKYATFPIILGYKIFFNRQYDMSQFYDNCLLDGSWF